MSAPRLHSPLAAGIAVLAGTLGAAPAQAQVQTQWQAPAAAPAAPTLIWQSCATIGSDAARLACYDALAAKERAPAAPAEPEQATAPSAPTRAANPATTPAQPTASLPVTADAPTATAGAGLTITGCDDQRHSLMTRYWELAPGASCGVFRIRSYRPLTVGVVLASNVNQQPTSGNPDNVVSTPAPYRKQEVRLQLSVRTKLAQGLLTPEDGPGMDGLWLGYTQQSYWQVFVDKISRPFRNTDHEPEIFYTYPTRLDLPLGWRMPMAGIGLAHQSNGQALPYSRSWNRVYLMAGFERDRSLQMQARIWKRLPENAATDDNPEISQRIGRAELATTWQADAKNRFILTGRHPLHGSGGSLKLEWLRTVADDDLNSGPFGNALRLHASLFSGYGDSLIDYNHRRTVFLLGFSLFAN